MCSLPHCSLYSPSAPSGPPLSFTIAAVTSTTLTLTWLPPEESQRNGLITAYRVACEPQSDRLPAVVSSSSLESQMVEFTSDGFSAGTRYTCSVYAQTGAGEGPPAVRTAVTPEDCKPVCCVDDHMLHETLITCLLLVEVKQVISLYIL